MAAGFGFPRLQYSLFGGRGLVGWIADMAEAEPQTCLHTCISCGYDLSTINARQCPECGYTATLEDMSLDSRRRIYLQLTKVSAWFLPAAAIAVAVLTRQPDFLVVLPLSAVAAAAGCFVSRPQPSLHRRIFRRSWWMSMCWWFAPLIVLSLASTAIDMWIRHTNKGIYVEWWDWRALMFLESVVVVLFSPVWYFGWRRSARIAGLPEALRTRTTFWRGASLACLPVLVGVTVLILVAGVRRLFDL